MIINYTHGFTFVHCPKTAGSSIAVYLSPLLGRDDLQIGIWEEATAAGHRPNRRFYRDIFVPPRLSTFTRIIRWRHIPMTTRLSRLQSREYEAALGSRPTHAAAAAIRIFDPTAWERHFKFAFVRNPYDRVVSYYKFTERDRAVVGHEPRSFRDFVNVLASGGERLIGDTWPLYTIDDRIAVDFVGRFENLQGDMEHVCERIGIPFDATRFPHEKKGDGRSYRDHYTPVERQIVADLSAREAAHFGYEF